MKQKERDQKILDLINMLSNHKSDNEIHSYLLELKKIKNIDFNKRDEIDNTPLILCANRNYIKSASLLLELGCDVNLYNRFKYSALYWAASSNYKELTNVLIKYNADFLLINHNGKSIMFTALEEGNSEIALSLIHLLSIEEIIKLQNELKEIKPISKYNEKKILMKTSQAPHIYLQAMVEQISKIKFKKIMENNLPIKSENVTGKNKI